MFENIAKAINNPDFIFTPFPVITNRIAWNALPAELKSGLVKHAQSLQDCPYPVILATDFMSFCRNGNRTDYEDKLFNRRTMLCSFVLAECIEHQGRFIDDIINGIYLICEESAWQLPAHNSYLRDTPQLMLPDISRPIIDLFAAEAGALLGMTHYLLEPVLTEVSPAIATTIYTHLNKRLIQPYLSEHFWWMGDGISKMNNWTAWCTQNILLTACCLPLSAETKTAVLNQACKSLDYFLAEYDEDGCCDEGAGYYRHAGLCLFNSIELLNLITNDDFAAVFHQKKVKNIAAYILNVHVNDQYYANFADCAAIAGRCSAREYLFGKRTANADLMAFAAIDYQHREDPLLVTELNLFYRLQTIFTYSEMCQYNKKETIAHTDLYYSSVGLFLVRDEHLFLAVKAGDNDDSHNHNDTGSFTIYKDGLPLFIDIGVESYTKKTFSPERYQIWTMQSAYHNLPTFQHVMQKNGTAYQATHVSYQLDQDFATISMDIAAAYDDPQIHSYLRTATLFKGSHILIEDQYTGTKEPVILSLMTAQKPSVSGNQIQIGNLGRCQITGCCDINVETIQINDPRLRQSWNHDVYRCLVTFSGNAVSLLIQ